MNRNGVARAHAAEIIAPRLSRFVFSGLLKDLPFTEYVQLHVHERNIKAWLSYLAAGFEFVGRFLPAGFDATHTQSFGLPLIKDDTRMAYPPSDGYLGMEVSAEHLRKYCAEHPQTTILCN